KCTRLKGQPEFDGIPPETHSKLLMSFRARIGLKFLRKILHDKSPTVVGIGGTQPASKLRKRENCLINCEGRALLQKVTSIVAKFFAHTQQDDAVPRLRNPVVLRFNDEGVGVN